MKRGTMILIVVIAALLIASGMCMMEARAEEQGLRPLIVTASGLYGRQHPEPPGEAGRGKLDQCVREAAALSDAGSGAAGICGSGGG